MEGFRSKAGGGMAQDLSKTVPNSPQLGKLERGVTWPGGGRPAYLRLIDSCITQLKAQGPSRTCNEIKEEDSHDGERDVMTGAE